MIRTEEKRKEKVTVILPIFKMLSGRRTVGYRTGEAFRPHLFLSL